MAENIVLRNAIILLMSLGLVLSIDEIAFGRWDGVGAYLAVDARRVQCYLDHYALSSGAPRLFVPAVPVFSTLLPGQHVMYVSFGTITSLDFKEMADLDSEGSETTVVIPFLSDRPNGPPHYNLALGQIYQADRGDIPQVDVLLPYIAVDELTVGDSSAILRDRGEEMAVTFQVSSPCTEPAEMVFEEFHELVVKDLTFVSQAPDLTFCERHQSIPSSNRYCSIMKEIRRDVEKNLPNVCASFSLTGEHACEGSLKVTNITQGFRDLLFLGNEPTRVVSSERYYGNITTSLKYPCIEKGLPFMP